jgi:peptidoglycan/xylan/chitin deacetylase (PgdA/CDA1 family)
MGPPRIVTTSWDDGDPDDFRVAELLHSRGLSGTFYIPFTSPLGGKTLAPADLKSLRSGGFEIGAHGVSHRVLTELSPQELLGEVRDSKSRLEDTLGQPVDMFCYPKGRSNRKVIRQVKEAGYKGARTTCMLRQGLDFNPFRMPTSLVAHPDTRTLYARNLLRGRNFSGLICYLNQLIRVDSWATMGKILFDRVLREGGVWHLYGHSWEIEQCGLWTELAETLDYVSRCEGVLYKPNGGVLNYLPAESLQPSPVAKRSLG